MVFGIDDLIEGVSIVGLLGTIASYIFSLAPEASEVAELGGDVMDIAEEGYYENELENMASSAIKNSSILGSDSSMEILESMFDDTALQGLVEINQALPSKPIIEDFSMYSGIAEDVYTNMGQIVRTDKSSFINSVKKVIASVAKKVPKDTAGFKKLITDICTAVLSKKGLTVAAGAVGIGAGVVGTAHAIRKAYNGGKHLPKDVNKTYEDVKSSGNKITNDIKNDVSDLVDMLPSDDAEDFK